MAYKKKIHDKIIEMIESTGNNNLYCKDIMNRNDFDETDVWDTLDKMLSDGIIFEQSSMYYIGML